MPTQKLLERLLAPALALAFAMVIATVIVALLGEDPFHIASVMLSGSLGSLRSLANTLEEATPLILTGLCVAIGMQSGLFNIGGEGQLVVGAFIAAWLGVKVPVSNAGLHVALCLVAAGIGGAIWAGIAGILRAKLGAHEVINTIMLNYVAFISTNYLVNLPYFKKPGQIPQTFDVAPSAEIPRLTFVYNYTRLNAGLFVAIGAALLIWIVLSKTSFGFEIRCVGHNPVASRVGAISVVRSMILAMSIGGFLAGVAGAERVLGVHKHFVSPFPFGYGFGGIAVALLARNNPFGVVVTAIFFGALASGGAQVDMVTSIPRELVTVIQAIIILFIACEYLFSRYRPRMRVLKDE